MSKLSKEIWSYIGVSVISLLLGMTIVYASCHKYIVYKQEVEKDAVGLVLLKYKTMCNYFVYEGWGGDQRTEAVKNAVMLERLYQVNMDSYKSKYNLPTEYVTF